MYGRGAGGGAGGGKASGDVERERLLKHRLLLEKRLRGAWTSRSTPVNPTALSDTAAVWGEIASDVKPRVLLSLLQRDSLGGTVAEAAQALIRVAAADKEPWVQIVLALMSELAPALVKPDDVKGAVAVLEKHRSSVVDTVRAKLDSGLKGEDGPLHPMSAPLEFKYLSPHLLPADLEIAPELAHFTVSKSAPDMGAPGKNPFGKAGEERIGVGGASAAFADRVAHGHGGRAAARHRPAPTNHPERRRREGFGELPGAKKPRTSVKMMDDTARSGVGAGASRDATGATSGAGGGAAAGGAGGGAAKASTSAGPTKESVFGKDHNRLREEDWKLYLAMMRGDPMPEGRKEVSFDVHSRAAVESDGGVSYQVTVATLDWAAKKVKLRKAKKRSE